ncbi:MAG TPA: YoaK family protein [Xanthobacteraceae bacterium]|jgi:uncharacterized membrane protein YoaK (UPF0700 family)|nr:YoaK family protein [Xanthobacteraceae bacterium]
MSKAPLLREVPLALPVLLSFVAGYVDSYTYLALFGLFAAQVTGSFVIAGAEMIRHDFGVAGKILAVLSFIAAAAVTAALIGRARLQGRAALPWMLGLEAALLWVFAVLVLFGPKVQSAEDWHGIIAGIFAAMAMGTQSVLVRLLMKGIPQTNVMTGNMTQLGIAMNDLVVAWRKFRRSTHDASALNTYREVRGQLVTVFSIALAFLIGAAAGAVAFATTGLPGALVAVVIVCALTVWAIAHERHRS